MASEESGQVGYGKLLHRFYETLIPRVSSVLSSCIRPREIRGTGGSTRRGAKDAYIHDNHRRHSVSTSSSVSGRPTGISKNIGQDKVSLRGGILGAILSEIGSVAASKAAGGLIEKSGSRTAQKVYQIFEKASKAKDTFDAFVELIQTVSGDGGDGGEDHNKNNNNNNKNKNDNDNDFEDDYEEFLERKRRVASLEEEKATLAEEIAKTNEEAAKTREKTAKIEEDTRSLKGETNKNKTDNSPQKSSGASSPRAETPREEGITDFLSPVQDDSDRGNSPFSTPQTPHKGHHPQPNEQGEVLIPQTSPFTARDTGLGDLFKQPITQAKYFLYPACPRKVYRNITNCVTDRCWLICDRCQEKMIRPVGDEWRALCTVCRLTPTSRPWWAGLSLYRNNGNPEQEQVQEQVKLTPEGKRKRQVQDDDDDEYEFGPKPLGADGVSPTQERRELKKPRHAAGHRPRASLLPLPQRPGRLSSLLWKAVMKTMDMGATRPLLLTPGAFRILTVIHRSPPRNPSMYQSKNPSVKRLVAIPSGRAG
ncbi:Uu.00g128630.m01.CDS01 [Anthostomella pinea]|uniref:Uu.00g128630.m01.CDS01 n=1 Tax=Anthostomella pinea TaxID=933095 RepID=A0AAI8VJG4_9PEZI|nr:Uu.00g128630.m01.CDS01 [Anthostomella pinea]